jgi:hypothetical protein
VLIAEGWHGELQVQTGGRLLPIFTETCLDGMGSSDWGVRHTESPVRSLWEKANLNWVWTWMAIYGGSLSVLAAYVASTIAAATAEVVKETK